MEPGCREESFPAGLALSAGPVLSMPRLASISSAPCLPCIPAPLFESSQSLPPSPGIPQVRFKRPKALAPHTSTAAAPLSSWDRHVGSAASSLSHLASRLNSFSPLVISPRPSQDAVPGGGSAANQERAGRKGRGAFCARSFFASGVPNGFKMKGVQSCGRLGREGLRGSPRHRRQPRRGTSWCRV